MGAFGTAEHAIIQEINMKENILSVSKERERNRSRTLGTVRASLSVSIRRVFLQLFHAFPNFCECFYLPHTNTDKIFTFCLSTNSVKRLYVSIELYQQDSRPISAHVFKRLFSCNRRVSAYMKPSSLADSSVFVGWNIYSL